MVFDMSWCGEFIFLIRGSWDLRCCSSSSFYKFSLFWISGPLVALNARVCGGCFVYPLRNLKIPPFITITYFEGNMIHVHANVRSGQCSSFVVPLAAVVLAVGLAGKRVMVVHRRFMPICARL